MKEALLYALAVATQRAERAGAERVHVAHILCAFIVKYCNDAGISKSHIIEHLSLSLRGWKHD